MAVPPEASLVLGERLGGRYTVVSYLAPGGFCFLFEGKDHSTGEEVAIKVLQIGANADDRLEFSTEAELLERLKKASSIVDIIDFGRHELQVTTSTGSVVPLPVDFLVLELASACLTELVVRRQELSWNRRLLLFRGVVRGIHQMHLQRVVHRDLKSENVLVFPTGTEGESKICDLGRSRDTSMPARFTVQDYLSGRGDFRFAPPEVLWMQGSDQEGFWRRIDLYHLGSVLFELATGQGLTSFAVGNGIALVNFMVTLSEGERHSRYVSALPQLVTKFEAAYQHFGSLLPPVIRYEAQTLLRTLSRPDPAKRGPRPRESRVSNVRDLQWILRRVDILSLVLRTSEAKPRVRRKVPSP
jgi:eukaryotic-like serine/threonine-protein kinase